jgi:hypothetical protein
MTRIGRSRSFHNQGAGQEVGLNRVKRLTMYKN